MERLLHFKSKVPWYLVLFIVFSAVVFQNCGDEVSFNQEANSENPFGVGQTRKLVINPNLADSRPPIQLTTLVDNSNSTQYIQDNLQAGFSKAIDQVQGFNVNVTLHTLSHDQGKDKSASEKIEVVSYQDTNGQEVVLPGSDVSQVPVGTDYFEKEVFQLSAPWFSSRQTLSYNFSEDSFADFKQAYTSGIAALGTDGSAEELGLCSLFKKIEHNSKVEDPENKAYHLYLLATNEDDFTTLNNCPVETRKATRHITSEKEVTCAAGEPGCELQYTIEQNPKTEKKAKIDYTYDRATMKVHYSGTRSKEVVSYSKDVANHSISYQERESTYTYTVMKTCYNDGVPEDCPSTETQTVRTGGACTLTARSCNSGDKSKASTLFKTPQGELRSCNVSCSDNWYNRSLAESKIPNRSNSCSFTTRSCDTNDLNAVLADSGASNADVRNCSRKCDAEVDTGSYTLWNKISSCSTASRACNSSERQSAAGRLNVAVGDVKTCNYSCSEPTRSGSKTYSTNTFRCDFSGRRDCSAAEQDWLMSKNPGIMEANLNVCEMSCDLNNVSDSIEISSSGLSCPSTQSCSSSQKNQAAADFPGSASDLKSCNVSCDVESTNPPNCVLDKITDSNLCSNTSEVASLCAAKNRNDLNMSSCRRGNNGTKKEVTEKVQKDPKVTVKIDDLNNADAGKSIPEIVAGRLTEAHGAKGFFTSFFIHPSNDPTCLPPPNMSLGEKYEEVAQLLGPSNASTFPVCSNDYSPALESIIQIAIQSVLTTFNLSMADNEKVFQVDAVFLDGSKQGIPESEYEVFKKTIIFNNKDILKDIKTLEISVWRPE